MRRGIDSAGMARPWASKEIVVDRLLVPTPPWLESTSEGMRVWRRRTAGDHLVERDRVFQVDADVGPREPHVDGVVPDELPAGGMRQAAEDGHVAPMRLSGSSGLGQLDSPAPSVWGNQCQLLEVGADSCLGSATPLPKKKAQNRFGRSAGGSACAMASSQGKASDSPAPRRKVRRSRCQEGRAMVGHLSDPDEINDLIP